MYIIILSYILLYLKLLEYYIRLNLNIKFYIYHQFFISKQICCRNCSHLCIQVKKYCSIHDYISIRCAVGAFELSVKNLKMWCSAFNMEPWGTLKIIRSHLANIEIIEEKRGSRKYDLNMFISMHPRKQTEASKLQDNVHITEDFLKYRHWDQIQTF